MLLSFDPNFYDCVQMTLRAEQCARQGDCWDPLRPVGLSLYMALPEHLGLPHEALIAQNFLLMTACILVSLAGLRALFPDLKQSLGRSLLLALLLCGVFVRFAAPWARVPSSDFPGAAFAVLGLWGAVAALRKPSLLRYAWTGLAWGAATLIRSFYLFPCLALLALLGLWALGRPRGLRHTLALFLAWGALVGAQFRLTQVHTGSFSFIAPDKASYWADQHFSSALVGAYTFYDGSAPQSVVLKAQGCGILSVRGAWEARNWPGLYCLFKQRQAYYFSAYIDRAFPTGVQEGLAVRILNRLALFTALLALVTIGGRPALLLLAYLFLIWAEASIIAPEFRFMMGVNLLLGSLGGAWLLSRGIRQPAPLPVPAPDAPPLPEAPPPRRAARKRKAR